MTNITGTTANFSVAATGSGTLTYQWRKDGSALAGQTTATLTLNSLLATDAGGYSVVVANGSGSVTSLVATLTIHVPPFITTPPASVTTPPAAVEPVKGGDETPRPTEVPSQVTKPAPESAPRP
mgnify:CR=1 FL=1